MTTTNYNVTVSENNDSQLGAWLDMASTLSASRRTVSQAKGTATYLVETTDAVALEAALEADASVLEYAVA